MMLDWSLIPFCTLTLIIIIGGAAALNIVLVASYQRYFGSVVPLSIMRWDTIDLTE